MPIPRNKIVSPALTPYYHCTSKCVRGAYLCGKDSSTGKDYKHRKNWLEKRLLKLADIFAIHLCAYAVMDNHFHVVFKIDWPEADNWSKTEVINRWHRIFNGHFLSHKFLKAQTLTAEETDELDHLVGIWRHRLHNIGWFMRCIKEPIARRANLEESCHGRFWEGRFHSQALLDEKALAACMAYVDLNPFRARLCKYPEQATQTSLHNRIITKDSAHKCTPRGLMSFSEHDSSNDNTLPFSLVDYLELVDWTAKNLGKSEQARLEQEAPSILLTFALDVDRWPDLIETLGTRLHTMVGSYSSIRRACIEMKKRCVWGSEACTYFLGR